MEKLPTVRRLLALALATVCARSAPAAEWRDWEVPGCGASASFAPARDTRKQKFSRGELAAYSSLYATIGFPGEIVVEGGGAQPPAESPGDGTLGVRVEIFRVDLDKSGKPSAPTTGNFAQNPFLPFGLPSGNMGYPVFSTVTRYRAGTQFPLRARFHIPNHPYSYYPATIFRACWTLFRESPGGREEVLARGILPDAFLFQNDYATWDQPGAASTNLPAALCSVARDIVQEQSGFPGAEALCAEARGTLGLMTGGNVGLIDRPESYDPRTIPNNLLGMPARRYMATTAAFLVGTFLLAGALLLRFFVFRKGEARLAVWWALPALSLAAGAFALLAAPLVLDRSSRVDVTRWRYSIHGVGRELWIDTARAVGFDPLPAYWTTPSGGWFAASDYVYAGTIEYAADGAATLEGANAKVCTLQKATAVRLADCQGPKFTLTPDEEAAAALRLDPPADGDRAALEKSPLAALLRSWTFPNDKAPRRILTAHGDYSAVLVFARNRWFDIGPMKDGEERDISAAKPAEGVMRYWRSKSIGLLEGAPMALATKPVVDAADQWLAAVSGRERMDGYGRPIPVPERVPALERGLVELLDDAIVVGRRAGDVPPEEPAVRWSAARPRPQKRTGRIVDVEVIR